MLTSAFIVPCQPKLASVPPDGSDWLHEVKFDGWRIQVHINTRGVLIYSRNGNDLPVRLSALANRIKSVLVGTACVIDDKLVMRRRIVGKWVNAPEFYKTI